MKGNRYDVAENGVAICYNLSFVARLSVKVSGNGKNVHTYIGPVP